MGGAAGCRLPVPDGGRTAADDCKFADNRKRALGAWLFDPGEAFTADSPLIPDASDSERLTAACLLERALERTRRASLASKDSRTAAALTKWEELVLLIPSLQNLRKLEFEGDYDTSEANERVLLVAAEYIRGRPKNALGDLVKADTVAGAVSALTRAAEGFYGRKVLCASGGLLLRDSLQAMRREDGPAGDRALSIPMRQSHLAALAGEDCPFDIMSPGWPQVRWAMMQASHQALMRGGEPGRVPRQPFRPALGICWKHLTWLDPASREAATVEIEGATHHLLFLAVRPIKDQKGTHKRVPIPIVSKHPVEEGLADLTCPFAAIRRAWDARVGLAPWRRLQDAPFFTGPDGVSAVSTDDVSRAIRDAALALRLQPEVFNASALRRGGATDLRAQRGSAGGKAVIVQRGRWCETDIDDIYSRASLEEHADASIALATAGGGRSLEQAAPGWTQPTRFGR